MYINIINNIKYLKCISILQICLMHFSYSTGDLVLFCKFCADRPQTSLPSSHSNRDLPSQHHLHRHFKTEFLMLLVKPATPTIFPTSNGNSIQPLAQAKISALLTLVFFSQLQRHSIVSTFKTEQESRHS